MPVRHNEKNYITYVPCLQTFRCRSRCFLQIPEGDRQEIFSKFYALETKNEQDAYLQALMECSKISRKRPRVNQNNAKPKSKSYKYFVSCSSGKYCVCKNTFVSIHGTTVDRVRRLANLLSLGKAPNDRRGKNTPGNAKPGRVVRQVEEHIRSFPIKNSHYGSRNYRYLSEKLDIKQMHELFLTSNPELSDVKYSFYRKIFKERFSLSFGRPQVDTCCTCEELSNKIKSKALNDVAKRVAVAEKIVHQRRAKKFYSKMKSIQELCQTDVTVGGICVDFMQNLALPVIPVQETFYLHQLSVNVFNIHNLSTGRSMFYVYHEGMGKKGPNEVCSFIMDYINREIPTNIRNFHIFSDGCGGQNKNHSVIRMCLGLVDLKRFQTVNEYFPIRGHSYMPCDRNFAMVKRKINKNDRIFLLKDYVSLIVSSSTKKNFSVYLIVEENILIKDYKKWWPIYYKKNCLSTESYGRGVRKEDKVSFLISNFMHFSYSEEAKGVVTARNFIDGLIKHDFRLGTSTVVRSFPAVVAYPNTKVPISAKKMVNIKKFERFIVGKDEEIENFYRQIFEWPTVGGDEDDVYED